MSSKNDAALKERFGRVVHAHTDFGPYIGRNGVAVHDVLALVDAGLNYNQICKKIHGLTIKDVMACNAYRVRFLEDTLAQAYDGENDDPYFVLDENISYLILPEVYRLFGRSTSVLAEGLFFHRNDDEKDVLAFASENGYEAILTQDSDFRTIARKHGLSLQGEFQAASLPKVVMIPHGLSVRGVTDLLRRHQDEIGRVVRSEGMYATYRVHREGVCEHDLLPLKLKAA